MSSSGPVLALRNPLSQQQHLRCAMRVCQLWHKSGDTRTRAVLDVGCGAGEAGAILRQINEALGLPAVEVVGVDPDDAALQRAAMRHDFWDQRELEPTSRWMAKRWDEAAEAIDAVDLAICLGSRHAFGDSCEATEQMLIQLQKVLRPGGLLWIADGTWRIDPEEDYLQATGLQRDELLRPEQWHDLFDRLGLNLVHEEQTSVEDFRSYEQVFWNHAEQAVQTQPDCQQAQAAAEHWRNWAAAFERWGAHTMGFHGWVLRPASN